MLNSRNASQDGLFIGTPVCVQFTPPLSQGLDLVFRLQVNRREVGPRRSVADVAAKEECLLSVEEETMFRPVGEVSARVQDEEPDHQHNMRSKV